MKRIHIFTSAACNYIPKVRLLFQSLRQHHPEARLHLLLADELPEGMDLSNEPVDEIVSVSQLCLERREAWAFCHSIVELATAIKPLYLRELLARDDCAAVLYMDPDTVAYSPLNDVVGALTEIDGASIVLTPHLCDAETDIAGVRNNELSALKHGTYNLGFVGVRASDEGRRFAAWWANRCYHFCRSEIPNGIFTDQKWCDLVPGLFDEVAIARTRRLNVAPWNVSHRNLHKTQLGYRVGPDDASEALGFYHFTGFDSGAHRIAAAGEAITNVALAELIDWYAAEIQRLAQDPLAQTPWHYGQYSSGRLVGKPDRFLYRQRGDLQDAFQNPFDSTHGGFEAWIETQGRSEYPLLFEANTQAAEMARLSADVGYGFSWRPKGAEGVLSEARSSLIKRGIRLLRREGLLGVARRLTAK